MIDAQAFAEAELDVLKCLENLKDGYTTISDDFLRAIHGIGVDTDVVSSELLQDLKEKYIILLKGLSELAKTTSDLVESMYGENNGKAN